MVSQVNSTKHVEKDNNLSFSNYSNTLQRKNASKFILCGQQLYQNQTKVSQKQKLQANISDEYRCKNPQQNISKINPKDA